MSQTCHRPSRSVHSIRHIAFNMAAATINASTPVLAAGACQSRRVQPRAATSAPLRATAFKGTTLKSAAIKVARKQGGFVCKAACGDVRVCLTADPCLIWKPRAPPVCCWPCSDMQSMYNQSDACHSSHPTVAVPPQAWQPMETHPQHKPLVGNVAPEFSATAVFDQEFIDVKLSDYKVSPLFWCGGGVVGLIQVATPSGQEVCGAVLLPSGLYLCLPN